MARKSITVEVLSRTTGEWCRGIGSTIQEAKLDAFKKADRKLSVQKTAKPIKRSKGASA